MSDGKTALAPDRRFARGADLQRPPWATEASVRRNCTGCGQCIEVCPQNILFAAYAKTPAVDFEAGECTFCGACAEACAEDVFLDKSERPWNLVATIQDKCMLVAGIGCQLCTDSCDAEALRIDLSQRPVGRILTTAEACTGCGACIPVCPVGAIALAPHKEVTVDA